MRKRDHRGHVSQERWLISYADFITLLFALFVVLFAFARADQKKQTEVKAAIDTAFKSMGVFSLTGFRPNSAKKDTGEVPAAPVTVIMAEEKLSPTRVKQDLESIDRELQEKLAGPVAQHTIVIKMGRNGLVISLREAGFFNSGSATPRSEAIPALRQIAASLGNSGYDVRVEGHTDNVPIQTEQFQSNWELSSARATRIARLLLEVGTINPERVSAAGFAEFHPVDTNDTAAGRANNRRVDLVIEPRSGVDLRALKNTSSSGAWRKITDDE